jgi:DNA mismatch repair protein MutL
MKDGGQQSSDGGLYTVDGFRRLQHEEGERHVASAGTPPADRGNGKDAGVTSRPMHGLRLEEPAARPVPPEPDQEGLLDVTQGELQYRGSLFSTFLIFEGDDAVILVDQHAAHERINYERFLRLYAGDDSMKNLLIPINFTPPASTYGALLDAIDSLREAGIEIEPFGDESFNILTLPGFIPENREEETVALLFDAFYEGELNLSTAEIRDTFVKIAACRASVKEGDAILPAEARALIQDLLSADVPFVCPHGRPTMVRYGKDYFEKLFGRR